MKNLIKIDFRKNKTPSTVLGLALDGSRLEGVVLNRTNGSVQVQQSFSVALSLDPLTAAPELTGREIRNHLDAAGIRERQCAVAVPLKWALTVHSEIPQLPEADLASFLQIEAERGFLYDISTLRYATSRCQLPNGKQYATFVGIPNNHLALLEQALTAAKLKPISFSLALPALQPPKDEQSNGVMALLISENHVGLQITSNGGVAALRTLESVIESGGGRRTLQADLITRELRITLGQLPEALRQTIRRVRIFGPRELGQQLADEIELRLESMNLEAEVVSTHADKEFGLVVPSKTPISPAFNPAVRLLAGRKPEFEFRLPKPTAWQQFNARYSSGKLRTIGTVAAAVVLVFALPFAYQQWQLISLQSKWNRMAKNANQLDDLQQHIRQFRPWYDDSVRGLAILKVLTTNFPEDGVVSAKSVEIRDLATVTCTGTARDTQSLRKTLDKLGADGNVTDLKLEQIRGRAPMQFTFNFHWNEGGKGAN